MKCRDNIQQKGRFFMNNQMTIQSNYNIQMELPLEGIIENGNYPKKKQKKLVFQPYNNKQTMMILDIEMFVPENHIARLVDEMVESIPDEILYSYYVGGGRAPFHPKMLLKVILFAYTQKNILVEKLKKCCMKIFR